MWYLWALFLYQLSTPFFLKHISLNRLMLLSFMVSIIAGFKLSQMIYWMFKELLAFIHFI